MGCQGSYEGDRQEHKVGVGAGMCKLPGLAWHEDPLCPEHKLFQGMASPRSQLPDASIAKLFSPALCEH